MKSGKTCFTKIRKWAIESGATIIDSKSFDSITIEYKGLIFEASQEFESTSKQVISRGRGLKWAGNPSGFYFGEKQGHRVHKFKTTQTEAIKLMEKEGKLK
jgi:hypothetical protein